MFNVHQETNLTGNFRLHRGRLQCEVLIAVRGPEPDAYKTYRDATPADCELAECLTRKAA